jgi:hypothetical protein
MVGAGGMTTDLRVELIQWLHSLMPAHRAG